MIRNLANRLIRLVYPRWITTGEKLRLLNTYYTAVTVEPTTGTLVDDFNSDYYIICSKDGASSDIHICKSRKEAINRAYEELHKIVFFTQLHRS